MNDALQHKLETLRTQLRSYESVLVAFSGGVDSTLLLRAAIEALGDRVHALTCVSVTMAQAEARDARALGEELGLGTRHHVVESNELERDGFADNDLDRCALCKTELMSIAGPLQHRLKLGAVALGTNTDDLGDYRPGIRAAAESGARSPMVDAGLSKSDVRDLSRHYGLRTWDKPQLACLSSRFPHGTKITAERLRRVDDFEDGLRELGFSQLRVRFHDSVARLELNKEQLLRTLEPGIRERIVALGKTCGFRHIALDLEGFRSGSMNPQKLIELRRSS